MLITLTGSDADSNPLTYTVVTPPTHGTLSGTAPNVYYHPATNYNGGDVFWFKVNDGIVDSALAAVSITVQPVNDAPVANGQNISTPQDTAKSITLTGSDVDGDPLTFSVTATPSHGTLSGTAPSLTYTPDTSFTGTDTFWFAANDGTANSTLAAVVITVTSTNTSNPQTNDLPLVSVIAGANASEPNITGRFLFTRTGNLAKSLTAFYTLDGNAIPGVDYSNPGNKITFAAGRSNATLLIKPIADKKFEGARTVVLSLLESTNIDVGSLDSAAISIGDDDRPHISITSIHPQLSKGLAARVGFDLQTKVSAKAYTNFNLVLQGSTDLTNWTIVSTPPPQQPVDYLDANPVDAPARFYRVLYIYGEVTDSSVAEAVANQMISANIVGTVNVSMPPGWSLAANPLNGQPTDGPLGNLPEGTKFAPFQSTRANTFSGNSWNRGTPLTRSTQGGWLYNPSSEAVNVTYVGEVPSLGSKTILPLGWSVRSSPITTKVGDELLGYALQVGDAVYEFNPNGTWTSHHYGTNGWDLPPTLEAGRGELIYKSRPTKASATTPAPQLPGFIQFTPVNN
jgi:hypothetical protein